MSRVDAFDPARGRIEAALAVINAGAMPDPDRAQMRASREIERRCRTWPTAAQVASLRSARGMWACRERWAWISDRELFRLAAEGGATLDDGGDE